MATDPRRGGADAAVRRLFLRAQIDVEDEAQARDAAADLTFVRQRRVSWEKRVLLRAKVTLIVFGCLMTGAVTVFAQYLVGRLRP